MALVQWCCCFLFIFWFWMLIREEPIIAPPTAHHVIFCSCPLALFLLLFTFNSSCLHPAVTRQCTKRVIVDVVISYPLCISLSPSLSLFAVYASVARVVLSSYNSPLYLVSNGEEEEDCGAVLR